MHINHATDAVAALKTRCSLTAREGKAVVGTHVHVMETRVDFGKRAMVGHVLVDLDFALEVVYTARRSDVYLHHSKAITYLPRGQEVQCDP